MLDKIIHNRRSVKKFKSTKPDWRTIIECIDAMRYAPMAGNNYSLKFILVDDKDKINKYLTNLKLELHHDKSKIIPLRNGITFLGYRIFYHYKLLRKSNITKFNKKLMLLKEQYNNGMISNEKIINFIGGWYGYAMWANTYKLKKSILKLKCPNQKYLLDVQLLFIKSML